MHDDRRLLIGTLAILGAAASFGTLGVVTRFAYADGLDATTLGAWRAVFGTLALGLLIGVRGRLGHQHVIPHGIPRRELGILGILAVLGFLVNIGLFTAYGRMTIALGLLGFYTYPAVIALAGAVFLGEPLHRARLGALVLAVVGMALVVLGGLDPANGVSVDGLGLAFAIGAGASQASIVLLTNHTIRTIPSEHQSWAMLTAMSVIFVAWAVGAGDLDRLALPLADPQLLALMLYAGVITAALSTFLFFAGIHRIGSLRAGIGSLFEPVVGAVLAGLVLGESLTPVQLVGGALVLVAAGLVQRQPVGTPAELGMAGEAAPLA